MRQQIAVFVNRAALDRQIIAPELGQCRLEAGCAVARDARLWRDDYELRAVQAALVQIAKKAGPRGRALTPHVSD